MSKDFLISTPEEAGIPSDGILGFISELEEKKVRLHSFIVLRGDRIAAEAYYKPFHRDFKHRLYSVSKSFVSAGIALLIGEGKLSLDTRVAEYFTDYLPSDPDENILSATVRDLLMMSSPHLCTTYDFDRAEDVNWARTFFTTPSDHAPGTLFNYDTSATDVLAALVERVSGEEMLEYMRPRLLDKIGFSSDAWCIKNPEGNSSGGSGIMCTTRDLARMALVFKNYGEWNGEQLLPRAYVDAATSRQIASNKFGFGGDLCESLGYGFFLWQTRGGSFSMLGMGDQSATVVREKDLTVVINADNQHSPTAREAIFSAMWKNIVDRCAEEALPENKEAGACLAAKLETLTLPVRSGDLYSPLEERIGGHTASMKPTKLDWSAMRIDFEADKVILNYTTPRGEKSLTFGRGYYLAGKFPETHYNGKRFHEAAGREFDCVGCAVWADQKTLSLRCDVIDWHLGNVNLTIAFKGNDVVVQANYNAEWFLREYNGIGVGHFRDIE